MMRSATRSVASTFGVIVGLAGLEHGIGEILQGHVAPPGVMFESWPNSQVLRVMSGEPAMSLLPDLLLSGVLTVLLSLATIVWSVAFLERRHGGLVLMLLSFLLLLVGGGIAPPLMGLIVGGAATRIRKPLTRWSTRGRASPPPLLARLWPYMLAASVIGYLCLLPGIPVASQFAELEDPSIVGYLALFSFATLVLAVVGALASDSYRSGQARPGTTAEA
jgi:hypothetical protein